MIFCFSTYNVFCEYWIFKNKKKISKHWISIFVWFMEILKMQMPNCRILHAIDNKNEIVTLNQLERVNRYFLFFSFESIKWSCDCQSKWNGVKLNEMKWNKGNHYYSKYHSSIWMRSANLFGMLELMVWYDWMVNIWKVKKKTTDCM